MSTRTATAALLSCSTTASPSPWASPSRAPCTASLHPAPRILVTRYDTVTSCICPPYACVCKVRLFAERTPGPAFSCYRPLTYGVRDRPSLQGGAKGHAPLPHYGSQAPSSQKPPSHHMVCWYLRREKLLVSRCLCLPVLLGDFRIFRQHWFAYEASAGISAAWFVACCARFWFYKSHGYTYMITRNKLSNLCIIYVYGGWLLTALSAACREVLCLACLHTSNHPSRPYPITCPQACTASL